MARVVELVDARDSKSRAARRAGSIPASGTSFMKSTYLFHSSYLLLGLLGCAIHASLASAETISLNCARVESNLTEEYALKVVSPIEGPKGSKGKVYFDGRDLDQLGSEGRQEIKNVSIAKDKISFLTDTSFPPEKFDGVHYGAGTVVSLTTISRATGELKKIETIKGGFLATTMGEGTRSYTEQCSPIKSN